MRVIVLDQSRWKWGIACTLALTAVLNVADGAKHVRFASPIASLEKSENPSPSYAEYNPVARRTQAWMFGEEGAPVNTTLPHQTGEGDPLQASAPAYTLHPAAGTATASEAIQTVHGMPLRGHSGQPVTPVLSYSMHPIVREGADMSGTSAKTPLMLYAASGMQPGQQGPVYVPAAPPADMLQSASTTAPLLTMPGIQIVNGRAVQPSMYTPVFPIAGPPAAVKPRSAVPGSDVMERLKRDEALRDRGVVSTPNSPKLSNILTNGLALVGAYVTARKGVQGAAAIYKLAKGMGGF